MRFVRSVQRQVDLRRLGDQLPVLGESYFALQYRQHVVTGDKLFGYSQGHHDSETGYFVIQDHHLTVPYICL